MFKKPLHSVILGFFLTIGITQAQVFVGVAPPRPLVERRLARPGPRYVWTPGYHRWDGRAYVWVPGQWVLRPRPRAIWVPARWVHRPRGWVFVEGHWR